MQYSIVLPCYNEQKTLPLLFAGFEEIAHEFSNLEVIYVNNGSTDQTKMVLGDLLSENPQQVARIVHIAENKGYGAGILEGLRAANGEFIGWSHADTQYHPGIVAEGFRKLAGAREPGKSFVKGRRRGRGAFDVFFTAGMSLVSSLALSVRLEDINAQPKLFPRGFLELLNDAPWDFSLDLYALYQARRNNYTLIEMPVHFGERIHGEAKGGGSLHLKWKLTARTLKFITKLRKQVSRERR